MRLHHFYVGSNIELKHDFWVHDEQLLHQWRNVLRFQPGQEVLLFDGITHDRLYKIVELTDREAHLEFVTDFERKVPAKKVYLLWSLLKKDKNDWVLQKCTELGVSHFIPLLADRSEKTGFNIERAQKIVIEASEQCGRSDIPAVREPMHIATAIEELKAKVALYICEQDGTDTAEDSKNIGVLIGPEGGWSEAEKQLFKEQGIKHLNLHDFTLRAETAAVAASTKMIQ
jgi:16S rRNA (uracil1498-N3)-methyltransferase